MEERGEIARRELPFRDACGQYQARDRRRRNRGALHHARQRTLSIARATESGRCRAHGAEVCGSPTGRQQRSRGLKILSLLLLAATQQFSVQVEPSQPWAFTRNTFYLD